MAHSAAGDPDTGVLGLLRAMDNHKDLAKAIGSEERLQSTNLRTR